MKSIKKLKSVISVVFILTILSCGSELVIPFIIGLSATWQDVNDPDHRIEIRPSMENRNAKSGIFTGRELHETDDLRDSNLISGTFEGENIAFTILRRKIDPDEEVTYSGIMQTVEEGDSARVVRIELTSSEGPLILE